MVCIFLQVSTDNYLALLGKLNRVVDEVEQHLAQAGHITQHPFGYVVAHVCQ